MSRLAEDGNRSGARLILPDHDSGRHSPVVAVAVAAAVLWGTRGDKTPDARMRRFGEIPLASIEQRNWRVSCKSSYRETRFIDSRMYGARMRRITA